MKIINMSEAKNFASSVAACAPSLPRVRGASRKLHFVSCAADELFRSVPRA
jgi:hypothetical protein